MKLKGLEVIVTARCWIRGELEEIRGDRKGLGEIWTWLQGIKKDRKRSKIAEAFPFNNPQYIQPLNEQLILINR